MRLTLLSSLFAVTLLSSTAVYAAGTASSISDLPAKGKVNIQGVVDYVEDRDTFTLRDARGETITINTRGAADVRAGEVVAVNGYKTSKAGNAQIKATNVKVDHEATARYMHEHKKVAVNDKTRSWERSQLANPTPKDARDSFRSHRVTYGSEMWARNEEYRKEGVNAVAEGNPAYYHQNSIAALPRHGTVTLTGVVDKVRNDRTFILRDTHGKTIDVHTMAQARVRAGDAVSVNGNVNSEVLGFGRQIENAQVNTLSAQR